MNHTAIEEMKKITEAEINDEWKEQMIERLSPYITPAFKTELEGMNPQLLDCVMIDYNCYNRLLRLEGKLPEYVPISDGEKYRRHLIEKGHLKPEEVN
jgi:hypothetical protein